MGATFTGQIMSGLPLAMALVWAPDLSLWTIVALVSLLLMWRRSILDIDRQSEGKTFREAMYRLAELVFQERSLLFCSIGVIGVMAAMHRGPHLPRYYAMAVPLVAVILADVVFSLKGTGPRFTGLLAGGILLNLINWSGAMYPPMEWGMEYIARIPARSIVRSGSFLERSHEYLGDLRSTQSLIKTLVAKRHDDTVVCAIPFNFVLAYPSFGYVEQPLTGYSISRTGDSIPEFRKASQLLMDQPLKSIYIRVDSYFYFASNIIEIPKPSEQDEILYTDGDRYSSALTMYRKRWNPDPPTEEQRRRFFERMAWPRSRLAVHFTATRWREGLSGCDSMLRRRLEEKDLPTDLRAEITTVADAVAERRRSSPSRKIAQPAQPRPACTSREQWPNFIEPMGCWSRKLPKIPRTRLMTLLLSLVRC